MNLLMDFLLDLTNGIVWIILDNWSSLTDTK